MALSWKKTLAGLVIAGGIGGAIWMAVQQEPVPVDIATLTRGPLEVTINAAGRTQIRDIFEVSAPVAGKVMRSPVNVGDDVVAGETIVARIEPGAPAFLDQRARIQAEAALAQAVAAVKLAVTQIAIAEADLGHVQLQLVRINDLHARGTIASAQLEQAELAVDISAAHLEQAYASLRMRESEVDAARAVLIVPGQGEETSAEASGCCVELVAPVSGEVLSLANESARMVAAGTPILSIGQMQNLEIVVELLSNDAVRIGAGATAYVERWGGPEVLTAKVRVIEPAAFTKVSALGIEEQRVKVLLDFTTDAQARPSFGQGGLGHGFRVYLRIIEWRGEDVLLLPVSALFRQDGDWAVFVARADDNGAAIASLRKVEIGRRNSGHAEVLSGLEEGARVVTHPSDRVSEAVPLVDREDL